MREGETILRQRCDSLEKEEIVNYVESELIDSLNYHGLLTFNTNTSWMYVNIIVWDKYLKVIFPGTQGVPFLNFKINYNIN